MFSTTDHSTRGSNFGQGELSSHPTSFFLITHAMINFTHIHIYIYTWSRVPCSYPPQWYGSSGSTPFPSICKLLAAFLRSSLVFARFLLPQSAYVLPIVIYIYTCYVSTSYIYIYFDITYKYTYIFIYIHTYMHTSTHIYIHTSTYIYIYINTHIFIFIYIYIYIYTHINIFIYMYIYIHLHIYICI